jgi:hypothetical protein
VSLPEAVSPIFIGIAGGTLAKTPDRISFRTIHLAKSMSFGDFPVSAVADAESLVLKPGSCQLW